jgi:hypothetical protein
MPISFVGAGAAVIGNDVSVPVPAGVAEGDLLLIVSSSGQVATIPTGWVSFYTQAGGRSLTVIGKKASASESSAFMFTGASQGAAVMVAYRGASYWDVQTAASGSGVSVQANAVTTRFANEYVLSIYTVGAVAGNTWTAPSGTDTRVLQNGSALGCGLLVVDNLQATAGLTLPRIATNSPSGLIWTACTLAIKEPTTFYVDPQNGLDANNGQTFATALKNISGATSAKAVQPGDTVRVKEAPLYNTGVNATWTSVQQRGVSPFSSLAITGMTNTTPVVMTTSLAHGYSTGDVVLISGNAAFNANGTWKITVISPTQFSLDDSALSGSTSTGSPISPIFCRTIKTASALVKPIASFAPRLTVSLGSRQTWTPSTNVTATFSATNTIGKGGAQYDIITMAAGFTTGKIAYYTLPATLDLSAYQQLSLFIWQQTAGTLLGGLTISLCSDTTGDTAVDTFTIPSTNATGIWCPFTIDKGSALGSSIQSISISRATNNGSQQFFFNSIVACKAPTAVDALSNTSLITKNNGTEGAYSVGGFGGSDGTVVFLDNNPLDNPNTTTGGAYYGTTETASLWRYEPFNPWTLNSAALPPTTFTSTSYTVYSVFGLRGFRVAYSGGWDSTNMSTRTGQTWFSNQSGYGIGLSPTSWTETSRINYTRGSILVNPSSSVTGMILDACNYTASSNSGFSSTSTPEMQLLNCIFTNATQHNFNSGGNSNDPLNPSIFSGCTFSGASINNYNGVTNSGNPYLNITNCTFNTAASSGININTHPMVGSITNCSINYFNATGLTATNNIIGTSSNLTFVPEPNGGSQIISGQLSSGNSVLPQNIYTIFNNIIVNAPTTTYSQGVTNFSYLITGCANFKFFNSNFIATNVAYGSGNLIYDQGGAYFYNCTGIPAQTAIVGLNVLPSTLNVAQYSQDEGNTVGNNKIYFPTVGLATSQTAVRNTPSGYAWSLAPTNTTQVTSQFPLKLKLASVAANGGSAVTISAYMRRTNTGLTMQLVCPGGQPYGPSTDTVASISAVANTWQQVSISFTPTQNAVYDIYVYVYGGTTFTGYVDDVEVTQ